MSTRLLENILNQPAALAAVGAHHFGAGHGALMSAAELLGSKKKVVLTGMGASLFACISLSYRLNARGVSTTVVDAAELLYFLDRQIDSDTAVVLVSRSGESIEVTKLLPLLREHGAGVVGVANVPESTLIRQADQGIVISSPPDQMVAIQSYAATVATFALLDAAMTGELERAKPELGMAASIFARWIPECVARRDTWTEFLGTPTPLYYLGRGATTGAVAEGVLLMHETAKCSAIGMTPAQFRHGPVEVVDQNFRAVLLGTQPPTVSLDAALGRDLIAMGGQVRWLGPVPPESELVPFCEWPEGLPERFTPIAETVPLQLAAYRKAELNGVQPGDFRWAPLVTTSEAGFSIPTNK